MSPEGRERPLEIGGDRGRQVDLLVGDASKARQKLGWKPKTSFAQLVKDMVASDLEEARHEAANGKRSV